MRFQTRTVTNRSVLIERQKEISKVSSVRPRWTPAIRPTPDISSEFLGFLGERRAFAKLHCA